jgi:predicted RND superfamily exporter protein
VGTATSRAVFYSAATTIASFGSLALSSHPGIASLGLLLVIGMVVMAGCNLLVIPALLTLLTGSREAPLEAQPSTSRG